MELLSVSIVPFQDNAAYTISLFGGYFNMI